jgi:hypothetical protein
LKFISLLSKSFVFCVFVLFTNNIYLFGAFKRRIFHSHQHQQHHHNQPQQRHINDLASLKQPHSNKVIEIEFDSLSRNDVDELKSSCNSSNNNNNNNNSNNNTIRPKKKVVTFKLEDSIQTNSNNCCEDIVAKRMNNIVEGDSLIVDSASSRSYYYPFQFNVSNYLPNLPEKLSQNSLFVLVCIVLNQIVLSTFLLTTLTSGIYKEHYEIENKLNLYSYTTLVSAFGNKEVDCIF